MNTMARVAKGAKSMSDGVLLALFLMPIKRLRLLLATGPCLGRPFGLSLVPVLLALLGGQSAFAAEGDSFAEAIDLGVATEWDATGREFLGTIEDVEGADEQYLKFEIQIAGPIHVWTSGAFNPSLRLFDSAQMPVVTRWRSSHYLHPVDAGVYYIVARSSAAGRYRLHVAGGGEGHDDVGNVHETAMLVTPTQGSEEPPLDLYRIDFGWDRDFFMFKIPPGSPRWVRTYTSGQTNTRAWLYESCVDDPNDPETPPESCIIELEFDSADGAGSNFHIDRALEPGTYYVSVWGGSANTTGLYRFHLSTGDDHGNLFDTASRAPLPSATRGSIDYFGDWDYYWFQVSTPGNVVIETTGNAGGVLYDSYEIELERRSGFRFERDLEPGVYYIVVTGSYRDWQGFSSNRTGSYTLHLSGEASGVDIVPLVPSANDPRGLWGLVRLINHSPADATVGVTAVDDTGERWGSFELELAGWQTINFNSNDLEYGNMDKRIAGVGNGSGNWYLELAPSRPDIEALAYVRTGDGPLASMHTYSPNFGRTHRVATFNPGSNSNRASRLRLINLRCPQMEQMEQSCPAANVTIFGVDDAGVRSPNVQLQIASGAVREVTAAQLEGLERPDWLLGSLGDGEGKWQLFVSSDLPIHVMSLLENTTGQVTNLSAPATHRVFSAVPERGAAGQSDVQ